MRASTSCSACPSDETSQIILIIGITAIALYSVVRGLEAGVKLLSEINMVLAFALLAFVLFAGPTLLLLTGIGDFLLAYVQYLPALSNPVGRDDVNFMQGWTAFYWAWWISAGRPSSACSSRACRVAGRCGNS